MLRQLLQVFFEWNNEKNERRKLQQAYIVLIILGLVIGGPIMLLSERATEVILWSVRALVIFAIANMLAWLVLSSIVSPWLTSLQRRLQRENKKKS